MTDVSVLSYDFIIEEDEVIHSMDIEVFDFKEYFKIGGLLNNKIYENGHQTIYFDPLENPFEILYNDSLEWDFKIENVDFVTKTEYVLHHDEIGIIADTGTKCVTHQDILNMHDDHLEYTWIDSYEKFVSGRLTN